MNKLPKNWINALFGDVIVSMSNGISGTQNKEGKGLPVSRIETIASQRVDFSRIGFIVDFDVEKAERYRLQRNDILFSHINSPAHIGKTALFATDQPLYHGINLLRIVVDHEVVHPKFFNYNCQFTRLRGEFSMRAQHAVNQSSLNQAKLSAFEIPLAPLPEQKRIADKLDATLARVDACRDRLARVAPILKRFRQSVLAAAVSGRLTADWRAQQAGGDNIPLTTESPAQPAVIEPASGHQAQARSPDAAQRNPGNNTTSPNGINPDSGVDASASVLLGWSNEALAKLGAVTGGLTKNAKRNELALSRPYLRVANVYANQLRLDDIQEIGLSDKEFEKTRLKIGDLLIVEGNGSLDQIGRVAIWRGEIDDCSHQNHLIRWRSSGRVLPDFALYFLMSPSGRSQIVDVASSTTGLHTLSVTKVGALQLPVPPLAEQHEIVRRIESLFAFADRLEARLTAAQTAAEQLTPALLAKAFRGELVPQDPADAPASELLQRLTASCTSAAKPTRPRTPRQPA